MLLILWVVCLLEMLAAVLPVDVSILFRPIKDREERYTCLNAFETFFKCTYFCHQMAAVPTGCFAVGMMDRLLV